MGCIEKLIVRNFKSYEGTHEIGPFKTFSAIIGPNGAGKSNLMDAISFVLGVRTAKLRGQQVGDLVHKKESESQARVKRSAFVELVFKHEGEDEPLRLRRSVSSDGATKYSIDGKTVPWSGYRKQLEDVGVMHRTRMNFLVFQGDVESIAQKTPKELTELFEQISGSGQLISEYNALKEGAEQSEEKMSAQFEKKRNVTKEKRQMKEQKDEAVLYEESKNERAQLQLGFYLWQLFHLQKDIDANQETILEDNEHLENAKHEYDDLSKDGKEKSKAVAKDTRAKLKTQKKINEKQKRLEQKKTARIKRQEEIKHVQRKIDVSEQELKTAEDACNNSREKIDALEEEQKEAKSKIEELEQNILEEEKKQFDLDDDQLRTYYTGKEDAGARTAPDKEKLGKLKQSRQLDQEMQGNIQTQHGSLEERKLQYISSMEKLQSRKAEIEKNLSGNRKRLQSQRENRQEVVKRSSENARRRQQLANQLEECQRALQDAHADQRENDRDQKARETLEALKRHFGVRVHGRVSDLVEPVKNMYRTAVAVSLGINMDAIVVDDDKTAIECIRYMREQRAGWSSFIPLESVKVKPLNESYRRLGENVKLAIDVVEYNEKFHRAVQFALGNTLVCENLQEARRLCYQELGGRAKCVTLNGTLIHKNGNITGGTGDDIAKKAARWGDAEFRRLREERDKYLAELQELEHEVVESDEQFNAEIVRLDEQIQFEELELKSFSEKIDDVTNKLNAIQKDLDKKASELKKLGTQIGSKEKSENASNTKINEIEDEIFGDFCRAINVENIRVYEASRSGISEQFSAKRVELGDWESKIKVQLDYETSRKLDGPRKKMKKKLKGLKANMEKLDKEQTAFISEIEKDVEAMETIVESARQFNEQLEERKNELKDLKKKSSKFNSQIASLEKEIAQKESAVDNLRGFKTEILRRSEVEQVPLPYIGGKKRKGATSKASSRKRHRAADSTTEESESEINSTRESESESETDAKESDLESSVDLESSATDYSTAEIDFSKLNDPVEINDTHAYASRRDQYIKELETMDAKLEKLSPNLKAIEQFDDIQKRANQVSRDFNSAKEGNQSAQRAFEEIQEKRRERFQVAFDHVEKEIGGIYKQLTESHNFPLGGTVSLVLEDQENPFLDGIKYNAMPPMKRFRDMDQLSGGERTVAALAIIFAIHSFRPAPFFVLDEIDAALDSTNVSKVANYIRSRALVDDLQCIVISLKDTFYEKADALVGVFKDQIKESSGVLTLDLTEFDV